MSQKPSSVAATLYTLTDLRDRQDAAIKIFNRAMQENDIETICAVSDFILGEGAAGAVCDHYGRALQWHCLNWLTEHYRRGYSQSEDGSDEEKNAVHSLLDALWQHKALITTLPEDLNASAEDIATASELMRERHSDFRFSQAAVEKALMHQAILMGDAERARHHFQLWQNTESDEGSDCPACEQDSLVAYHHFTGDYAQALRAAEPILSGGLSCGEVPHITYYPVIDSLIRTGRQQDAAGLLAQAVEHLCREGGDFLMLLAPLIPLHAKLGQLQQAEEIFQEYGSEIFNRSQNNTLKYLHYVLAAAFFNDDAQQLAQQIAQDLDERNGNSYYQDRIALQFSVQVLH